MLTYFKMYIQKKTYCPLQRAMSDVKGERQCLRTRCFHVTTVLIVLAVDLVPRTRRKTNSIHSSPVVRQCPPVRRPPAYTVCGWYTAASPKSMVPLRALLLPLLLVSTNPRCSYDNLAVTFLYVAVRDPRKKAAILYPLLPRLRL